MGKVLQPATRPSSKAEHVASYADYIKRAPWTIHNFKLARSSRNISNLRNTVPAKARTPLYYA